MNDFTTIMISRDTHERLIEWINDNFIPSKGVSFEKGINKLLDEVESK